MTKRRPKIEAAGEADKFPRVKRDVKEVGRSREIRSIHAGERLRQKSPREQLYFGPPARARRPWLFNRVNLVRIHRMDSIWDQAHPHLRDLSLYEPGKPIEETARDFGLPVHRIVKLASNENPLGPSQARAGRDAGGALRARIFTPTAAACIYAQRSLRN